MDKFYCTANRLRVGPCTKQCAACKTDYRYGFDYPMGLPIQPNYQVPAKIVAVDITDYELYIYEMDRTWRLVFYTNNL